MSTTSEAIQQAVDSLEENTEAFDQFIEGASDEFVTTPDGQIFPTLANIVENSVFVDVNAVYNVTDPTGGPLRNFDPNTANVGQIADVLATLIKDLTTTA